MVIERDVLASLFDAAIKAASPAFVLPPYMPARPVGRTVVVGAGKAASQMAAAFEAEWKAPLEGLVVTRYGHAVPTRQIEVLEAAHPVPDAAGLEAAKRMMGLVRGLSPDDLVVALMSGGGSALLPAPAEGLTLADEQALTRLLLASGVPISAMNCLRGAISQVKGGRLASLAAPARIETLIISDVPGDDPADIAGGPTIPAKRLQDDPRAIADRYGLRLPPAIAAWLAGPRAPALRTDDPCFAANRVSVVASAHLSLQAAATRSLELGWTPHILGGAIEGEAQEVARVLAAISRNVSEWRQPFPAPCVILSGGETTVTVRGSGRGGRNGQFLLAFAIAVDGMKGISALAADTDGIDGSENNAGAFADGQSAARMRRAGIDPHRALAANDSFAAFGAIGDLFTTGPTGTNVNDFRAILVE